MNTFLYVLLAWIVVLFIANKLLARRKPKTVKILVQRNGKCTEVDAVVVQGSKRGDDSDDVEDDQEDGFFDLNPYTRENQTNGWAILARGDHQSK
ncbi:hypothetical protein M5248_002387 [Escherichia coli]|nr:hypothetical protein [Escherichia coli]